MFVDKAQVQISAGNGGDGVVSFRHEIYVDKGGPDGGDGGDGGNVVLVASRNQNTLASFRYTKQLKAEDGKPGDGARKHGRSGKDLIVAVPVGTAVIDEEGNIIADLVADEQQVVIAYGGKGGFGNAHFVSSVRQAPKVAEKGEKGDRLNVTFELRMIADIGLVGLPNAGKSSFLAAVSNARPEIADYPFTTLKPHLGVADVNGEALLLADIPGLIEGASQGKGLGDEFLRHIARCSALLHMIDINSNDVAEVYQTIRSELREYSQEIAEKSELIVFTKTETVTEDIIEMQHDLLRSVISAETPIFDISSYARHGLDAVLYELKRIVDENKQKQQISESEVDSTPIIQLKTTPDAWKIKKSDNSTFVVTGRKIERFADRTDFNNEHGVRRIRDIMSKMGIMHQLRRDGVNPGDRIVIGSPSRGEIIY